MNKSAKVFDTDSKLLVRRYKQGVMLTKPSSVDDYIKNSVADIFSLPLSVYFVDANNQIVNGNDISVALTGAQTHRDFIGNTIHGFVSKEFGRQVDRNNAKVIRNQRLYVIEETGVRKDDVAIQALTFKFPWYSEDKVIGLFGFSLSTPITSVTDFSQMMMQLMPTGLLGPDAFLPTHSSVNTQNELSILTKRENEVLGQLLRGKTAKEIGRTLNISNKTVEHHIESIRFKTKCKSRSELFDKFS